MKKTVTITLSEDALESIDTFCDVAGANRSNVIEVLIINFLEDLIREVAQLSKWGKKWSQNSEENEDEEEAENEAEEEEEE